MELLPGFFSHSHGGGLVGDLKPDRLAGLLRYLLVARVLRGLERSRAPGELGIVIGVAVIVRDERSQKRSNNGTANAIRHNESKKLNHRPEGNAEDAREEGKERDGPDNAERPD